MDFTLHFSQSLSLLLVQLITKQEGCVALCWNWPSFVENMRLRLQP